MPPNKKSTKQEKSLPQFPDAIANNRVKRLFSDIKRIENQPLTEVEALESKPNLENSDINFEFDVLRARILELEAQLKESEHRINTLLVQTGAAGAYPAVSTLYEKEQVGFAYRDENLQPIEAKNFDMAKLAHTITVPLTASEQTIGEMQIEPPVDHNWTPEETNLANAVAQQVSLQIQNLRLLAAAELARSEAQAASRQFAHQSWEAFLDGIHQSERIGYLYDQASVAFFAESAPVECDYQENVNVLNEHVGSLLLKTDPAHPLTDEDKALVSSVAQQLGQQVENLRLLADASRARADAEEATRRLTRDSWQKFTAQREDIALGFVYNSNEVSELGEATLPSDVNIVQPLTVRGETIGQLVVAGWKDVPSDAAGLMAAIGIQTSLHLETLRLTEELEKRAAELRELDRLKSSFLANMSHELRTPLNSILGFSDVMLEGIDGPLTDYMDNDLRLIQKNGQHLLHLINDVLDMAKIESGRMNLHPETFKVHDLFEEVTSITSTLASAKNLSLFIEDDSDKEVEIFADNTRIRQVLINLVNNSIKFTEKGKVTMRVDQLDSEKVLITVKDTGIGIPTTQLETIFQEFSQVDTTSTRKTGGTGLGLPISRRLVELHGGRLWAESTGVSGEGSSFYIELPREAIITEPIENLAR